MMWRDSEYPKIFRKVWILLPLYCYGADHNKWTKVCLLLHNERCITGFCRIPQGWVGTVDQTRHRCWHPLETPWKLYFAPTPRSETADFSPLTPRPKREVRYCQAFGRKCRCEFNFSFSVCGGLLDNADGGVFSTPNYPSNYGNNQECLWTVTAPRPTNVTTMITFEDFALENHVECYYDKFIVKAGDSESQIQYFNDVCYDGTKEYLNIDMIWSSFADTVREQSCYLLIFKILTVKSSFA